jgi:hypothetical protein
MLADKLHNSIYQFVAAVVGETSKGSGAAQMVLVIGITAGTAQRTLAGNLD